MSLVMEQCSHPFINIDNFSIFKYAIEINEWMRALLHYEKHLQQGHYNNELMPSHYKGHISGESYNCVDCNDSFILTDEEKKFYLRKNLTIPKRCSDCRDINRLNKGA